MGPQLSNEGLLCGLSKWVLCPLPPEPLQFSCHRGQVENLQAELSRGKEHMRLVAWTAGLEMPEGLSLWLVGGRQWSPLQMTMRIERKSGLLEWFGHLVSSRV